MRKSQTAPEPPKVRRELGVTFSSYNLAEVIPGVSEFRIEADAPEGVHKGMKITFTVTEVARYDA